MPVYNNCPPSEEEYCLNGGDCFYLSEDPTVYICSCFMPYYGPRCEHEAPRPGVNPVSHTAEFHQPESHNKRSVDRALVIAALVFIVAIFVGLMFIGFYYLTRKRRRRKKWKKDITLMSPKQGAEGKMEFGVQVCLDDTNALLHRSNNSLAFEVSRTDQCTSMDRTLRAGAIEAHSERTDMAHFEGVKPNYLDFGDEEGNVAGNGQIKPLEDTLPKKQSERLTIIRPRSSKTNNFAAPPMVKRPKKKREVTDHNVHNAITNVVSVIQPDIPENPSPFCSSQLSFISAIERDRYLDTDLPAPQVPVYSTSRYDPKNRAATQYLKNGPRSFTVASEHDALLCDLLYRGHDLQIPDEQMGSC